MSSLADISRRTSFQERCCEQLGTSFCSYLGKAGSKHGQAGLDVLHSPMKLAMSQACSKKQLGAVPSLCWPRMFPLLIAESLISRAVCCRIHLRALPGV